MEYTEAEQQLGRNVKYLRKKYFLSQRSLAALWEISVASLRKMEKGQTCKKTDILRLVRLYDIFCVSTDKLMKEDLQTLR